MDIVQDIVHFIFGSFWRWCGAFTMLVVICQTVYLCTRSLTVDLAQSLRKEEINGDQEDSKWDAAPCSS